MYRIGFTGRLAAFCARNPWRTVAAWVVVAVLGVLLSGGLNDILQTEGATTVKTEADLADDLYAAHFGGESPSQEYVLVESATPGATETDAFRASVAALVAEFRGLDTVASAVSYLDGVPGLTSGDGTVALIPVTLQGEGEDSDLAEPVIDAVKASDAGSGLRVTTLGNGSVNTEFTELADETLRKGETLGMPAALIILLLVFGTVVAAGLPLMLAIVAIVTALGLTTIVGRAFDLSVFVINMITMIGLAVGIDYSLFIVQRFREERAKGMTVVEAVEHSGDTATRAVFFSGLTVVVALTGLLIMPDTVMRSLGTGAILAVLVTMAAALTLLPAVLRLLGDRVNRLRIPGLHRAEYHEGGGRFWHAVTAVVTRRPIVSMVLSAGLLLVLAAPFLTLSIGNNFIESLPDGSDSRHAFDVLNEYFDSGLLTTRIVVDGPASDPAVLAAAEELVAALEADPVYGDVAVVPSPDGEIVVIDAVTKLDPSTNESRQEVRTLRTMAIPAAFSGTGAEVLVTGAAAATLDYVNIITSRTPLIFVLVLSFSFVLLMLVFRSIVVPIKAIVMNLLSVGAAYGLLVLVFQHGIGADLFGFRQTDVIEAWIPLFLFAVLFGLSMDYHIFLLSRIKERYDLTGDNDGSVAFGLGSTGSIITGAALIMVAVFGGFAAGNLVMFQQMGFGLAVAVILDATIVRSVLVPSTMKLLGKRNWYFPAWLEWLPEVHVEGKPHPALMAEAARMASEKSSAE